MSSPPIAMRANSRPEDPHFHPEEYLFRRVPTEIWDDPAEELGVDAVQLPDISVARSKYGHAEWSRFDVVNNRFHEEWGVVAVQVQDIHLSFGAREFFISSFEQIIAPRTGIIPMRKFACMKTRYTLINPIESPKTLI